MRTKLGITVLVVGLLTSACGATQPTNQPSSSAPTSQPSTDQPTDQPTVTQAPTSQAPTTQPPPTEGGPIGSVEPPATGGPEPSSEPPPIEVPLDPLPGPELETADDIAEFMYDPAYSEVVVVSMLNELGIGLYNTDRTAIRAGTETAAGDLFLFEPEARALIDMLQSLDDEDSWISFRDFHAALAGLGFTGSAEELAQAYTESYAAEPDASISKYVYSLSTIDVEAPIPRFIAWWLLVDGFVPQVAAEEVTGSGGGLGPVDVAANRRRGIGVARSRVRAVSSGALRANPMSVAHLALMVQRTGLRMSTATGQTHEGHGNPGNAVTFTATVATNAVALDNPFPPYQPLFVIQNGIVSGVPVTWRPGSSLQRHGTTAPPSSGTSITDSLGEARLVFTPQREDANGHGIEIHEPGQIEATVQASDVVTQVYGLPALGALVPRTITAQGQIDIGWHELETMKLTISNHYDVTIDVGLGRTDAVGDDEFVGELAQQPNGDWIGAVHGRATGQQTGEFLGTSHCGVIRWDATQELEGHGFEEPAGKITFIFIPTGQARGSMGSGKCRPTRRSVLHILLAPFNDSRVTSGGELIFDLPPHPGDTHIYPITGPGLNDVTWTVKIEFVSPPPP